MLGARRLVKTIPWIAKREVKSLHRELSEAPHMGRLSADLVGGGKYNGKSNDGQQIIESMHLEGQLGLKPLSLPLFNSQSL